MAENNNGKQTPKGPDTYTHRGAQTPTYTPPPMPNVAPAKPTPNTGKK